MATTVTDIAIVVVAVAVLLSLYRNRSIFLGTGECTSCESPSFELASLSRPLHALERVGWQRYRKTLILVLDTECCYCQVSAPFYRTVAERALGLDDVQVVALFPGSEERGLDFLQQSRIPILKVIQEDKLRLGIRGTPAILLADSDGRLHRMWMGRLSPEQEAEVISALLSPDGG